MKTFLLQNPRRILAAASLAIILGLFTTASAQTHYERVYATTQGWSKSGINVGIPFVLPAVQPFVKNSENAVSSSIQDSSVLSTGSGGLASVLPDLTQYLKFPTAVPANTPIHLKVSLPAGLLDLGGLLGHLEVGTFTNLKNTGPSGGASATKTRIYDSDNGLISLLSGEGTNDIIITNPDASCDGVYINLSALLSANTVIETTVNVFHAYYMAEEEGDPGCPAPLDILSGVTGSTGVGNIANATGSVSNQWNAIDDDPDLTTYATINVGASLLSKTYLNTEFDVPGKAGDTISITLQDPGNGVLNLLSAQILNSLSVQPYMDNTPVGAPIPIDNSGLIRLKLFPSEQSKGTLTVPIKAGDFNRVEIQFNGIADVAQGIRIYDVALVIPAPEPISFIVDQYGYEGTEIDLTELVDPNSNSDLVVWFDQEVGGSPIASPVTVQGDKTYYAASMRNGCSDASARTLVLKVKAASVTSNTLQTAHVGEPYEGQLQINVDVNPDLPEDPVYVLQNITGAFTAGVTNVTPINPSALFQRYAMAAVPPVYAAGPLTLLNRSVFAGTSIDNGLEMDEKGNITGTPEAEGSILIEADVFDQANNLKAGHVTKTLVIGAALPVNLSDFNLHLDNNKNVVLNWQTESEQGFIRFDVLRSNDGINFATIGSVKAAGVSTHTQKYSFTDNNPGAKSYYKLNVVKADGMESSAIVSIAGGRSAGFSITPNPASSDITITGINDIRTVNIFDASGRLIKSATSNTIDVRNLSSGVYFVTIVTRDGNTSKGKFVKK